MPNRPTSSSSRCAADARNFWFGTANLRLTIHIRRVKVSYHIPPCRVTGWFFVAVIHVCAVRQQRNCDVLCTIALRVTCDAYRTRAAVFSAPTWVFLRYFDTSAPTVGYFLPCHALLRAASVPCNSYTDEENCSQYRIVWIFSLFPFIARFYYSTQLCYSYFTLMFGGLLWRTASLLRVYWPCL